MFFDVFLGAGVSCWNFHNFILIAVFIRRLFICYK